MEGREKRGGGEGVNKGRVMVGVNERREVERDKRGGRIGSDGGGVRGRRGIGVGRVEGGGKRMGRVKE